MASIVDRALATLTPTDWSRRQFLQRTGLAGLGWLASQGLAGEQQAIAADKSPIRVGILHSLSGSLAITERSLVDAEELAIEQINRASGVLGRPIQVVLEDGASDWPTYNEKARKLIQEDKVSAIFGCWTSASRKSVLPVLERADHQLWYPATYEGMECSRNVFYAGAVPNQQVEPALQWLLKNGGKNVYLVGSDYVYPRYLNTIVKQRLRDWGVRLVGELYAPLGETDLVPMFEDIRQLLPKGGIVLNSLIGDSNVAFLKELRGRGLHPQHCTCLSTSLDEEGVVAIGAEFLTGHYLAQSYFQTVNTAANRRFVAAFKQKYGRDRVTTSTMAAAYSMVYLWKQAVEKAGTTQLEKVRAAAIGQSLESPEGTITLASSHHVSKFARVGQVQSNGSIRIVMQTQQPIQALPWNPAIPEVRGRTCQPANS